MSRNMRIDYYHVVLPPDPTATMDTILNLASRLPQDETRNVDYNHVPIRLQEIHRANSLWIGDLVRIRMDGIPPKTKLSGEQDDLDLDDDEGLGEETAFLFNQRLSVLVLQRNRHAVSAGGFSHYFASKGRVGYIKLDPILRRDAYVRMSKMRIQRKLEIAVAGIQNLNIVDTSVLGVASIINLANEYASPHVGITLSMGHTRGTLSHVTELARFLSSISERYSSLRHSPVTKITIMGKANEDEPMEVIDLLEDRMIDYSQVSVDRDYEASRRERQRALQVAFDNRSAELSQMLQATI